MAAGTDANRHLIAGLLQKLTTGQCWLVLGWPFALEADWVAPLGGCAETGGLCGHGSGSSRGS